MGSRPLEGSEESHRVLVDTSPGSWTSLPHGQGSLDPPRCRWFSSKVWLSLGSLAHRAALLLALPQPLGQPLMSSRSFQAMETMLRPCQKYAVETGPVPHHVGPLSPWLPWSHYKWGTSVDHLYLPALHAHNPHSRAREDTEPQLQGDTP